MFENFRGEDTRMTFAADLLNALGIYYSGDNDKEEIEIEPKPLDANRHSRIALVTFIIN